MTIGNYSINYANPRKFFLLASLTVSCGAWAFSEGHGNDKVVIKTSISASVGTSIRTENPNAAVLGGLAPARVGLPAGQLSATGNAGSSDLNFEKNKPVSTVLKIIGSLGISKGETGIYIRAKAWHDYAMTDENHPYGRCRLRPGCKAANCVNRRRWCGVGL